jgi:4a-hydroxytetrahydrobiopterin dehydratase
MSGLVSERCVACTPDTPPLTDAEFDELRRNVSGEWHAAERTRLVRHFRFRSFAAAFARAKQIADVAEAEGHHPDMCLGWGYLDVALTTHAVKRLSRNDFILAAKIDALDA